MSDKLVRDRNGVRLGIEAPADVRIEREKARNRRLRITNTIPAATLPPEYKPKKELTMPDISPCELATGDSLRYDDPLAEKVADAIREDRRQLRWTADAPIKESISKTSQLLLGVERWLKATERANGKCWVYASIGDVGWGLYVDGDLAEAKRLAVPLLTAKLARALAELREATGQ